MTLDEMAQELGVSKSTVSRALSGKGRIGEETRKRILEFAGQQGSVPTIKNTEGATRNLGVILPADVYASGAAYFQGCILGICETATFLDYDVLLTSGSANEISGIKTLVEKKKVDAIILMRSLENDKALKYLCEEGFPTGLTGICGYSDVIQVDTDNEAAAESLTSLLIAKGYRRFALILDEMEYMVNKSRHRGFSNAITRNNLSMEKQKVILGLKNDVMDAVLNDLISQRTECIICGDDVIASRVMSTLQSEGYRIPKDVSVASLYNSPSLDCFSPSVTTVSVSARQVGNMISKQVISFLEGREFQKRTTMDYEILVRRSANGIGDR